MTGRDLDSASMRAAKRVLVDGSRQTDAAKEQGISPKSVSIAVRQLKELAKASEDYVRAGILG